jgi:hypothetical protein
LSRSSAWFLPLLTLVSIAALGWVSVVAWNMGRAELLMMEPRHQISQWQRGSAKLSEEQWRVAQTKLNQALQHTPGNPGLHEILGALYAIKGQEVRADGAARRRYFSLAKFHQEQSVGLRATSSRAWASLAGSYAALGEPDAKIFNALSQAIHFGPHDPATQRLVFAVLISRWPDAPAALKDWARRLYQDRPLRARLKLDALLKEVRLDAQALK